MPRRSPARTASRPAPSSSGTSPPVAQRRTGIPHVRGHADLGRAGQTYQRGSISHVAATRRNLVDAWRSSAAGGGRRSPTPTGRVAWWGLQSCGGSGWLTTMGGQPTHGRPHRLAHHGERPERGLQARVQGPLPDPAHAVRRRVEGQRHPGHGRRTNTSASQLPHGHRNPYRLSQHSYGNAIDINTLENPYVTRSRVYPSAGRAFLKRSKARKGMIVKGGPIAREMARQGWRWGARWARPDYQHFSSNGG